MTKNISLLFIALILFSPISARAQSAAAIGQFTCEADVYYIWKKRQDAGNQPPAAVFYVRVGERGAVELDVKNKLLTRLSGVEADAVKGCQAEHHNISTCVATRLKTFAGEYHQMDFNARRVLLDTITEDCGNNAGSCIAAHTGPITCLFERPPTLVVPDDAGAAAGAKSGDKGKAPAPPAKKK